MPRPDSGWREPINTPPPAHRLPIGRVGVVGPSMVPTVRHGDQLFVLWRGRVRPGDVVVCRRPDRPGLVLVKRAVRREAGGWWVEGDNRFVADDSRVFGPVPDALVLGRVLGRYWPPRRLGRLRPSP